MFIFNIEQDDDIVYDIEVLPNIFLFGAQSMKTGERFCFEVSPFKDELSKFYTFMNELRYYNCRMIGFNNLGYDYPVIHMVYQYATAHIGVDEIYQKSKSIIDSDWNARFSHLVWESDWVVQQIDLFKVHHFDNKARATSLKKLEFVMRMANIEELPFSFDTHVDEAQAELLRHYLMEGDIPATKLFYEHSKEQLDFREQLTRKYDKNFMNHNDTKIGKDYFIMELEKQQPGSCYQKIGGRKTAIQTPREIIHLGDIILPYVKFNRPEFANVLEWLKDFSIAKTKGAFEFLDVPWVMARNMNRSIIKVRGLDYFEVPLMRDEPKYSKKSIDQIQSMLDKGIWLTEVYHDIRKLEADGELNYVLNNHPCKDESLRRERDYITFTSGYKDHSGLNCFVDDFRFDFGTGGIHGSIAPEVVEATDGYLIEDIDVKSYYPWIAIANGFKPEHLGDLFTYLYENMYDDRLTAQQNKQDAIQAMLKLALNGVYGDSNNQYSPFYDPQYTMSITINGQLLLCMLAEALLESDDVRMLQINTDGMTIRYPAHLKQWVTDVQRWWEGETNLTLESEFYSRMMIRDVNNYIAEYSEYTDDEGNHKLKRKGAYEYDRAWHQDHSALVVQKAAEHALVYGGDIEEFIYNHDDIFDFFLFIKIQRSAELQWGGETIQNNTRYYISNEGKPLTEVRMPTGELGAYKKKSGISNEFYEEILEQVGDAHDERIHTKNKSTYQMTTTTHHNGYVVEVCNKLDDVLELPDGGQPMSNLNYNWYVKEAEKLVNCMRKI